MSSDRVLVLFKLLEQDRTFSKRPAVLLLTDRT
jgi:hypothetical protein